MGPAGARGRESSERQLGFLWGGVALGMLLLSPWSGRFAAGMPPCPLRALTGIPCPGCGTTTAAVALAHLNVVGALAASPLATLGWAGLVGGGVVAGIAAIGGRGVPEPATGLSGRARAAIVLAVLANWVYVMLSR